jgi:hypothetical protein
MTAITSAAMAMVRVFTVDSLRSDVAAVWQNSSRFGGTQPPDQPPQPMGNTSNAVAKATPNR